MLRQLPAGDWLGGTIPYFLGQNGGQTTQDQLFVARLPDGAAQPIVVSYDVNTLPTVCLEGPEHGFSLIVIPAFSDVHTEFARHAPGYDDMFVKPLVGWVSGVHLQQEAQVPLAVNGQKLTFERNKAVVMHVPLLPNQVAKIDIINLFRQGDGPTLRFDTTGFRVDQCTVDGQPMRIADYIKSREIDIRLPLVADYHGAMVNACIKGLNEDGSMDLYGPVFPDVAYRFAAPVGDYVQAFAAQLPAQRQPVDIAFNCVLNYLYLNLEGKHIPDMLGPMSFGEVAYQLLNQTLVYLRVESC